jgi:hypothetical protein
MKKKRADDRLSFLRGYIGLRLGVSKRVEDSLRLPAPEMTIRPFQGWPACMTWRGRAWQAQEKLLGVHGQFLTTPYITPMSGYSCPQTGTETQRNET